MLTWKNLDVERIESKTYASNCVKKVISTILCCKVSHSFYTTVQLRIHKSSVPLLQLFSLSHSDNIGIRVIRIFFLLWRSKTVRGKISKYDDLLISLVENLPAECTISLSVLQPLVLICKNYKKAETLELRHQSHRAVLKFFVFNMKVRPILLS